jgi:hypothetical protein
MDIAMELRDFSMVINAVVGAWIMISAVHRLSRFKGGMFSIVMGGLFVALFCYQMLRQTLDWRGSESVLIALAQSAIMIVTGYLVSLLRRIVEKEEAKAQLAESAKSTD